MKFSWSEIKVFYEKYEGRLSTVALLFGFILDNLTLQRIDLLFENMVIIFYLTLSGLSILLLNYLNENRPQMKFLVGLHKFLPLFIQFAFGGLFSGFFIFYSRSATLSTSWPFILILLFLLVGNEFFRKYYQRMTFQISIYFLAIFSFSIFFTPILLDKLGPFIFVLSGVLSLVAISVFIWILSKIISTDFQKSKSGLSMSVVLLFVLINILYFTNLIPPIPLSLKDAGAYYSAQRVGQNYNLVGEDKSWYEFWQKDTLYLMAGESAYVFSSVFAPTDLNTEIVHDWQYFSKEEDEWLSISRINFPIRGGRDGGYRGFSEKFNPEEGEWRVDIKTDRGQVIGRVKFRIVKDSRTLDLKTETL